MVCVGVRRGVWELGGMCGSEGGVGGTEVWCVGGLRCGV